MKCLILAAATLLLIQGADAREHRGPPPLCPQPKVDCCPKPKPCKPEPKPCKPVPKPCKPEPKPCAEECAKPCEPCCPPTCFDHGFPTHPDCTPAAYSESAAIDLQCGWNTFMTASFIYWEAIQGGMDLAVPGQGTIAGGVLTVPAISAVRQKLLQTDFEYQPGFKVGLGWSGMKDNWVLYAEYTWLHGNTSTSGSAPNPDVATIDGIALPQSGVWFPTSFLPSNSANYRTTHISSKWNYKIDLVDAQISRPFYSGTRFLVEPFFGLRGAWIRQQLSLSATNLATTGVAVPATTRRAQYYSRGNGVGPRIGMNGNWHLGYGLRFMGNAAASLLFTDYDVNQNVDRSDSSGTFVFPQKTKIDDLNVLRPNLDLSLGLGWGSYFKCRRFHWDLAATYDFSVFWGQNMIRYLADTVQVGTQAAASDLYLQGLTIKTQFEF